MNGPEVTAPADRLWWRHSRLLESRSVVGALAVIAVVALFVVGVPFVDDNVEQTAGLDEAGRLIVDDYAAIALVEGWTVDSQSEFFFIVTDGTYQLVLPVSNEGDVTPVESLQDIHDTYVADPANEVTEISTFTTDAAAPAAAYRAVVASDPAGNGAAFAAVSQNGRSFEPSTTGPSDLDDPFYDTFLQMVRSVVITAEPRSGS